MEGGEFRRPIIWQAIDFADQTRIENTELALGFQEPDEGGQVCFIRSEVLEGIHRNDGVEEFIGKGKPASIGVDRKDTRIEPRLANAYWA